MKLISNNQLVFKQLVDAVAEAFGKSIDEITKDYFLLFLYRHFNVKLRLYFCSSFA